jgi:tetratricopeptide (TPR) repeat protein
MEYFVALDCLNHEEFNCCFRPLIRLFKTDRRMFRTPPLIIPGKDFAMIEFLKRNALPMTAAVSLSLAAFCPAYAAGSNTGTQPDKTQTTQTCTKGKVWDQKKQKCVDPQKSGFNDKQLFDAAREFAYAGQYQNALKVLKIAKNQNDPGILTYYGFVNRKQGNMDVAMGYYKRALAIDPNFLLARSYMGQGLIRMGDIDGARSQLVEIRDRGGKDTYAYNALYDALKRNITY